jgi:hypothetical protein
MHGKRSKFVQGYQIFYQIYKKKKIEISSDNWYYEDNESTYEKNNLNSQEDGGSVNTDFKHFTSVKKEEISSRNETAVKYSFETLLYRDIMKYCLIVGTNELFDSRVLSKDWILEENEGYKEYYLENAAKTRIGARVEYIDPTIREYLDDLQKLGLLLSIKTPTHNKEFKTVYKFTEFGKLIALILELDATKPKKLPQNMENEIFQLFNQRFEKSGSSIDRFCRIFYKKLYEKGIFNIVIDHYNKVLQDPIITNRFEFIKSSLLIQTGERSHPLLWKIYKESLDEIKEIDERKYKIFLFNLKNLIERLQEIKCRIPSLFEQIKYFYRDNEDIAVLEGFCSYCKKFTSMPYPLIEYLEDYHLRKNTVQVCINCGSRSLDFEIIIVDNNID